MNKLYFSKIKNPLDRLNLKKKGQQCMGTCFWCICIAFASLIGSINALRI